MKKFTSLFSILVVGISIFTGSILAIAVVSYVVCSIAEAGLPSGSANIGLGLLFLAVLINIPVLIYWLVRHLRQKPSKVENSQALPEVDRTTS